ncbi:restriction endonuclease subunit S [Rhizobium miluonense]|uniref:Type I restriction enzyme S subunit n=1 Tax=Rhizobium miluonense TaxID=411945 RepID=A0ABU1SR77_9HYPH|nr:restriction endonuclease subunit S [Rhizobium miluonense]MDR6901490.1 type I restriction enzyme S subunit [Rhizobium miluonense]
MSRDVPSGWRSVRLGEVAREDRSRNADGKIPSERLVGVFKNDGMIPMRERVKGVSVDRCKIVQPGSFAYNPMRINIGSIARSSHVDAVMVSPDYVVFSANERMLDGSYLEHLRRSAEWEAYVGNAGDGGVRIRIYFDHLAEFRFALPPLHEQRRIAEILSSVDEAIAATRAVIEQTRKVKQGVLERLLTKGIGHTRFKQTEIGEIPEGWDVGPLSRFGKVHTGKTPSTSDNDAWGGDTPFVTPGDLSDECAVIAGSNRYVSEHGTRQGRVMPAGAVAVTCIGSTIGKTGILSEPSMTNQQINTICCSKEVSVFVYETCVSLRSQLQRISGKQAVPIVNKSTFESICVPHPPRKEQIEIGRIARGIEEDIQNQLDTLTQLNLLKSALMSALLTGRKRVTDALPMAAE